MKALINILLVVLLHGALLAQQPPGVIWKQVYGGKKDEQTTSICVTHEGKIAVLGTTTSEPSNNKDAIWILLGTDGQKLKETRLDRNGDDELKAMTLTSDGGFALAGSTGGGKMAWLVKLNENGDTLWQKTISSKGKAFFNDIIETSDGGLLAAGGISTPEERMDMWIYRTYADGALASQKTYGNRGADEARSVVQDENGNIALAGITSQGKGGRNIWLFIIDKNGNPLYHRIFGSREYEEVNRIITTSDGGFALSGFAKAGKDGSGLKDAWLIKTAADGEMIWQSTFGGRSNDSAFGMTETTDGGLVLVGYTFSHLIGANTANALIVKADKAGRLAWQTDEIGGKQSDELTAAALLPDGSFVFAGTTSSSSENAKGDDLWVMRFNREFDVNTAIPTQLAVSDFKILDNNDGFLEEGENTFLTMTIENKGRQDAYDIDLVLQEMNGVKALSFSNFRKLGFLPAGQSKQVFMPVRGLEGLALGDAVFEAFCTDASRSRSQTVQLKMATKPLNLPSDFLDIAWLIPPGEGKSEAKSPTAPIRLRTRSDRKLNRSHFTIVLNGQPYKVGQKAGEAGLDDKGKTRNIFIYEYTNQIELQPGKNTVEVVVQNGDKKVSSSIVEIEYNNKPNLHILAVGIQHDDLKFTTQDAKDFAGSFAGQNGRLFDKVYMTTLVSGTRTAAGIFQTEGDVIKKAFRDLKENYNYTIYENDLLVVFLSSHGKTVNNDFKIIPTDFGMAGEKSLIDYRQDILEQLKSLPSRKLVFVDACHSGSFDRAANTGDVGKDNRSQTLTNLATAADAPYTLASCRAEESSWEDPQWGNGAFTKAILGAFQNEKFKDADGEFMPAGSDGIITIGELYDYIERRVPQMLLDAGKQGTQHPYLSPEQLGKVKDVKFFEVK